MERSPAKTVPGPRTTPQTDEACCPLRRVLRPLWRKWVAFGHLCARVNSAVLLTLIYFLVVPLTLFIRLKDPLGTKSGGETFWSDRKPVERSLRRHTLQF